MHKTGTEITIYAIYVVFSIICLIVALLLLLFYCFKGDMRSNSQKITFNLLISTFLVSSSSVLSLTRICKLCEGMQIVSLYSVIMWMTFANFLTATQNKIQWRTAFLNMIFFSYLLPFIIYLICQLTIQLELLDDSLYCTFYKQGDITAIALIVIIPTILLIYNLIMSYKSLKYLNKAKKLYPFLSVDIFLQKITPLVLMILFLTYFYSKAGFNLDFNPQHDYFYDLLDAYSHLSMQLGILLIMLVYGINPTLQKTQVLRNIQKFRTRLSEEITSQNNIRRSIPSFESELGQIEAHTSYLDEISTE